MNVTYRDKEHFAEGRAARRQPVLVVLGWGCGQHRGKVPICDFYAFHCPCERGAKHGVVIVGGGALLAACPWLGEGWAQEGTKSFRGLTAPPPIPSECCLIWAASRTQFCSSAAIMRVLGLRQGAGALGLYFWLSCLQSL